MMVGVSRCRPGRLGRAHGTWGRHSSNEGRPELVPLPLRGLAWPPSLSTAAHILPGWAPEAAPSRPAPPPEQRATGSRFLWFTLLFIELETEAKRGNVRPGIRAALDRRVSGTRPPLPLPHQASFPPDFGGNLSSSFHNILIHDTAFSRPL